MLLSLRHHSLSIRESIPASEGLRRTLECIISHDVFYQRVNSSIRRIKTIFSSSVILIPYIRESIPASEGLRLFYKHDTNWIPLIRESIPASEGLRLYTPNYGNFFKSIRESIPASEGLRQEVLALLSDYSRDQRVNSSKRRIKTFLSAQLRCISHSSESQFQQEKD